MYLKIETLLSEFAGVLLSMFVCALIAVHGPGGLANDFSDPVIPAPEVSDPAPEKPLWASLPDPDENRNFIRDLYRDPDYRNWVVSFFTSLCGSQNIAAIILANADAFDVSPSLAFALSWEESRYNPRAINRANRDESIDRGLFQLNGRSFPNIAEADFFNPSINAWYGMAHLRVCLDSGGSEIAALAMYNAGTGRVRFQGTPKNTLDYIHRILEHQRRIERAFQAEARRETEFRLAKNAENENGGDQNPELFPAETGGVTAEFAAAKPAWPRFVRLKPLTGWR
ncbi:MAG: lytic transglycosylase domain-containing protein [Treponema sp.]|jgi:hypothetical protein|nr:lytic transglycosylase domain-containing protein [Treponema sp.]